MTHLTDTTSAAATLTQYLRAHGVRTHSVRWIDRDSDNLVEIDLFDIDRATEVLTDSPYRITSTRRTRGSVGLKSTRTTTR